MKAITPFLWFDSDAEEAARYYTSIFPNSSIDHVERYGDNLPRPKGSVMTVAFTLNGQKFTALNGGPVFQFSPAISLYVSCETQEEVDLLWDRLGAGGEPGQCGWVTDKFGVTWQIVPTALGEMLQRGDAMKSGRMMQALQQMTKLDVAALRRAYEG